MDFFFNLLRQCLRLLKKTGTLDSLKIVSLLLGKGGRIPAFLKLSRSFSLPTGKKVHEKTESTINHFSS